MIYRPIAIGYVKQNNSHNKTLPKYIIVKMTDHKTTKQLNCTEK